ncbi:hypothetical protein D9M71_410340 [compost metagenome]
MALHAAAGEDRRHVGIGDRLADGRMLQRGRSDSGGRRPVAGLEPARDPALEQGDLGIAEEWRPGHGHARLAEPLQALDQLAGVWRAGLHYRAALAALEQLVEAGQAQAQGRGLAGMADHAAGLEDGLDSVETHVLREGRQPRQQQRTQHDRRQSLAHPSPLHLIARLSLVKQADLRRCAEPCPDPPVSLFEAGARRPQATGSVQSPLRNPGPSFARTVQKRLYTESPGRLVSSEPVVGNDGRRVSHHWRITA